MSYGLKIQHIEATNQVSIEIVNVETKELVYLPVQIPTKSTALNLLGFLEGIINSLKSEGVIISQIEVITDPKTAS